MNWSKVNLIEKTAKKKIVSHESYILNQNTDMSLCFQTLKHLFNNFASVYKHSGFKSDNQYVIQVL